MENPKLVQYLEQMCEAEPVLLNKLNRETHLKVLMPRMLSGHYQGRLLSLLSKLMAPKRILEIGTFTGYATICLAEGLTKEGLLHTIDCNYELKDMVESYLHSANLHQRIQCHWGKAEDIIPTLNEKFDMVFIDADKKNNLLYYNLVFDKVNSGGLIMIDNVLWSGKIIAGAMDKDTQNIETFNQFIVSDSRIEKLILPVRDGIFLARKK